MAEESTETSIALLKQMYADQTQHSNDFRDYMKQQMENFTNTIANVSQKVDKVVLEVGEIKIQTTKTNGRVTALEDFKTNMKEAKKAVIGNIWKIVSIILAAICTVGGTLTVTFIINHYKK